MSTFGPEGLQTIARCQDYESDDAGTIRFSTLSYICWHLTPACAAVAASARRRPIRIYCSLWIIRRRSVNTYTQTIDAYICIYIYMYIQTYIYIHAWHGNYNANARGFVLCICVCFVLCTLEQSIHDPRHADSNPVTQEPPPKTHGSTSPSTVGWEQKQFQKNQSICFWKRDESFAKNQ